MYIGTYVPDDQSFPVRDCRIGSHPLSLEPKRNVRASRDADSQLSPAHQSELLLRNCIDRGVCSLLLADKEMLFCREWDASEGLCDIREETILEFSFGRRSVGSDMCAQRELSLNWISVTRDFLTRFTEVFQCDFARSARNI